MRDVLSAGAEDSKRKTVNLLSLKTFGAVSAIGLVAAAPSLALETRWYLLNQHVLPRDLADDLNLSVETIIRLNGAIQDSYLDKGV